MKLNTTYTVVERDNGLWSVIVAYNPFDPTLQNSLVDKHMYTTLQRAIDRATRRAAVDSMFRDHIAASRARE